MSLTKLPVTLLLLALLFIGANSQGDSFLSKSEAQKPYIDDETCLHDPDCHRNVTICAFPGCCSYKECYDDGECVVMMPRCVNPDTIEPVDNETCLYDPECHQNVTVCYTEGCCSFKECPADGSECLVAMADCAMPEEPVEIDNTTCLYDPECHHNVTVCYMEGCCSFKECPADGSECMVALADCAAPEEPELDDQACFDDPNCRRNVTICSLPGCCNFKECPADGSECLIAMADCAMPEEPELDDQACFDDPNCRRNVTVCAFPGCCSWKECPIDGSECMIAMPMCVGPEPPILEVPEIIIEEPKKENPKVIKKALKKTAKESKVVKKSSKPKN